MIVEGRSAAVDPFDPALLLRPALSVLRHTLDDLDRWLRSRAAN
jgi:hypothetical protein